MFILHKYMKIYNKIIKVYIDQRSISHVIFIFLIF